MSHTYNVHIIHHRSKNQESAAKWGLRVWVLSCAVPTMVRLTFEEAQVVAQVTKALPGRAKANEILKACREKLQNRCDDC